MLPVPMNPLRWSFRAQCFLGFAICAGLLGYALYVQFVQQLEPCPFCIFQRLAFAATGVFFLLGGFFYGVLDILGQQVPASALGVTFGPTNDRNFSKKINQKMKQKALAMSLSDRLASGKLLIVDKLSFESFKTKDFAAMVEAFEKKILNDSRRDILVINDAKDEKALYSGRNLQGVKMIALENINIVDVLNHKNLLLTEKAAQALSDRYNK